jgi:hypothetical protein
MGAEGGYNNFVPIICAFDGIIIRMYYNDHPPAHFHIAYRGEFAKVGIDPITILAGTMSRNIRSKVFEWAAIHQAELRANWELARGHQPLFQIEPLD